LARRRISARIGLGHQQRTQLPRRDDDSLDIVHCNRIDHRGPARQLSDVRNEFTRPMFDDGHPIADPVIAADACRAGNDNDHAGAAFARCENQFIGRPGSGRTEAPQACDVSRQQDREQLMASDATIER
jgi:hypothetical protein